MEARLFFQRPKRFLLRLIVLRLARDKPVHGYEIMKQVEQLTGGDWVPAHSMIYRLLESLEKEGYLTSHKNHKGGVERTAYQSTDKGAELLREAVARMSALLSTMVTIQQPPPALDISRMLLEELPASERRAFLMRIRDWFRARLADVEQELSKIQSG